MKESNIAQQKSKEKGNLDNEISKNQTDAINSKPKKMLTDYLKNLIREVNQLRTNPVQYAEKLVKNKAF